MSLSTFREARWEKLGRFNEIRKNRCRSTKTFQKRADWFAPEARSGHLDWWRARNARARESRTLCPAGIIRAVFPAATEWAAISVASCESHLYTFARNASGASGLFQLMPIHWLGSFNPFDPWANTRYAYRLSSAGYDWGAWVCKP